jgi:hypothetical protein
MNYASKVRSLMTMTIDVLALVVFKTRACAFLAPADEWKGKG